MYADDEGGALPWSEKHWTAPSNPNGAMNYTDPAAANFHTNAYWQLWSYAGKNDGLWQCPSAAEDKAVTVSGDHSPLLGYMGNTFAIGVTASPLGLGPDILPKRLSSLINPSRAKLFTDIGANAQGVWVGMTYQNTIFTAQVVPVPLHRASLNAVMADAHAPQISRNEFRQPGGPAVPFQDDPRQNWWRAGAVATRWPEGGFRVASGWAVTRLGPSSPPLTPNLRAETAICREWILVFGSHRPTFATTS
jgi:hypothetical protein